MTACVFAELHNGVKFRIFLCFDMYIYANKPSRRLAAGIPLRCV